MERVRLRARLLHPWWRRRFAAFGDGSILHRPAWVYGPSHISIGRNVLALEGLWLSAERTTWEQGAPAIEIGDGVALRPHCTISASEKIVIEDDVVIAAFSTVIDSDHTWDAGHPNVLYNPARTGPIRIGRGTWIGERVSVLRGSTIGAFCLIGANSVVRGDIPDGSIAVGAPARVVGRTDVTLRDG
jgi:lipopolysaccharide O-acetyltransferase